MPLRSSSSTSCSHTTHACGIPLLATVVEANDDLALVEIRDDRGHGLDFISLPHHALASRGEAAERVAS